MEANKKMDLEFDWMTVGLAIILSSIFIIMIWKIPTWDNYPIKNKIAISVLLPVISYFIVAWKRNS